MLGVCLIFTVAFVLGFAGLVPHATCLIVGAELYSAI